jgi:hypothetical protein
VIILSLIAEKIIEKINVLSRELINLGTGSDASISGERAIVIISEISFKEDRRDNFLFTLTVVSGCLTMYFNNENGHTLFCFILF